MTTATKHAPAPLADLNIEAALLGGLLMADSTPQAQAVVGDVLTTLPVQAFVGVDHPAVYTALVDVWRRDGIPELLMVLNELKAAGVIDEPEVLLTDMVEHGSVVPVLRKLADQVMNLYRRRQLCELGRRLTDAAQDHSTPVAETVNGVMAQASDVVQDGRGSGASTSAQAVAEVVESISEGRVDRGLSTGYPDLDVLVGGLKRGQMIVLAARPSMGKSAILQAFVENATAANTPAVFFTLEMSRQQTAMRILSRSLRMDSRQIEAMAVEDFEMMQRLEAAAREAAERDGRATLYLEDGAGLTIEQLRIKARRYVESCGVGLIAVDYLGIMTPPPAESRYVEVTKLSAGLLAIARELDVPLLVAAQLNRAVETRQDKRPTLADLRDSGAIEQDAHVVMFLHRPAYYLRREPSAEYDPSTPDVAEIIVAKNRTGRTGIARLAFRQATTSFHSIRSDVTWSDHNV